MNKWILLMSSFVFGLAAQAGSLSVHIAPVPAQVLPVALDSCEGGHGTQGNLAAPAFAFTTFVVAWNGQGSFTPSSIQINLNSPALDDGHYSCTISGSELNAVFYPTRGLAEGSIMKSMCGIRCGGLNVKSDVDNAYIQGVAIVSGTQSASAGSVLNVQEVVPVSVGYIKP